MEKSEQGVFYESWIKKDHNTYFGLGAYISKGDTVLKEKLELHKTADHIVYIATVNKNIPVLFTLVSSSDRSWLFENKEHDFPQRINYNNMGSGKLYVKVSGIKDGKEVVEEIRAKKTITMRK
ncbi:MAG: hypothetical protein IH946_10395 [Bacteroidetes bacterium]|nr:hypothetical protein [Bacteroidota bacterium]